MRKVASGFLYVVFVIVILAVAPSLLNLIIAVLLVFAIHDFRWRRRDHFKQMLNSAIRVVSDQDQGLEKVVAAFSKSGPMKWQCYEYSQRLRAGQEPVAAAAVSGIPLELSTAISLRLPPGHSSIPAAEREEDANHLYREELGSIDNTTMPVYGQFVYLFLTAMVTCLVFRFMILFITPTVFKMLEEFGIASSLQQRWMRDGGTGWLLLGLVAMIVFVVPLLSRGHFFGMRFPSWLPLLPLSAERKSEILVGLADAIDSGMSLESALKIGHSISMRSNQRREIGHALQLVESGTPPMTAMQQSGWIRPSEAGWLSGASPHRAAELMRTIAEQNVRDANANARWFMELFFPAIILVLGGLVLGYAYGFFHALMELINGLS
ncbi:type II secretion system F family protein [Novipirellula artificiosorum]|uniref:Bacterial type II secretion system protein F domain protein n=1 Tax=Novipirellula artificiosorum TaxID=2528016 RepID=A0A5C6DA30_9BACT|nr:type II secretion system F family protein [Novipirellula artificiosorum]TWU32567.1 Bacterial type II secretion system protein F domain protein [Novipirellula artificiosorum]